MKIIVYIIYKSLSSSLCRSISKIKREWSWRNLKKKKARKNMAYFAYFQLSFFSANEICNQYGICQNLSCSLHMVSISPQERKTGQKRKKLRTALSTYRHNQKGDDLNTSPKKTTSSAEYFNHISPEQIKEKYF